MKSQVMYAMCDVQMYKCIQMFCLKRPNAGFSLD